MSHKSPTKRYKNEIKRLNKQIEAWVAESVSRGMVIEKIRRAVIDYRSLMPEELYEKLDNILNGHINGTCVANTSASQQSNGGDSA